MSFISRFANPIHFGRLSDRLMPLFALSAVIAFGASVYYALYAAFPDSQLGERTGLMYVHAPAAWMGIGLYAVMAIVATVGVVARSILVDVFCPAAAPVGVVLVGLCLTTGCLGGKLMWGTGWLWDTTLTPFFILLLFYCGYILSRHSFNDDTKGAKAGAALLLCGVVNIPMWHTLHPSVSLMRVDGSAIDVQEWRPLLLMATAYGFYTGFIIIYRMQTIFLTRKIERAKDKE